jgi:hypothetical protein
LENFSRCFSHFLSKKVSKGRHWDKGGGGIPFFVKLTEKNNISISSAQRRKGQIVKVASG